MLFVSGAWLFDGSRVKEGGCLVVDDNRILAVEERVPESIPEGAELLHFDDGFVMPGFIDAHNHLELGKGNDEAMMAAPLEELIERCRTNAQKNIMCGVTTMRLLGEREYLDLQFRQEIADGMYPGPRLITAGPWITASHGHGSYPVGADIADGPHEVRVAVRRHVKKRVEWAKFMVSGGIADSGDLSASYYSEEELRAGVEEAHRYGLRVSVHCYGGPGTMMSVQAGVDTIEHGSRITEMEALSLMAERSISVVYTAGIVWGHPEIKDVAPKATEAALAAGVNIALGADCNHGIFGFEAECAVANGMPAERALIAMTSASARACAVDDELGSLATGKLADVVVVRGNPVEDIKNLNDVLLVMKDGLTVNRPALAAA